MVMKSIYLSKRASHGDHFFGFTMSKRGQFFILSAVIMATIIVSMASVKNYIGTGDAPKKFYYYSQQLSDETGAVVDFALYNDPSGNNASVKANLNGFLQQGISKTMDAYPDMELFSCYSAADSTKLICQNNGTKTIKVSTVGMLVPVTIFGSKSPEVINYVCEEFDPADCYPPVTTGYLTISGKDKIIISPVGSPSYDIQIQRSSIQRGQFYFIMKMNSTSGNYVSDSTGTRQL